MLQNIKLLPESVRSTEKRSYYNRAGSEFPDFPTSGGDKERVEKSNRYISLFLSLDHVVISAIRGGRRVSLPEKQENCPFQPPKAFSHSGIFLGFITQV